MTPFPESWRALKVILAHDWLTGMRGGERVLELLCRAFPAAPIYSLLYRPAAVSDLIRSHPVTTSWLQRLPLIERYYRYALPLFPAAMERLCPEPADLLISTSHCVAKGLRAPSGTPHLCYCFTPMRYAWLFYEEYFGRNPLKKAALAPLLARLRAWDRETAARVTRFVTLSRHVQKRIREFYGRDADVVYPPVNHAYWTPAPANATSPESQSYDLVVSALVPYKRLDLAVRAYTRLGFPLKIVGTGTEFRRLRALAGPRIEFTGWLPDERIRELYRHCRLLVFPGEEDFGIVPVEAQACGTPVVAYGQGGSLESVVPGLSGIFFQEQTVDALLDAVARAAKHSWDPVAIRANTERFSEARFIQGLAESIRLCLPAAR